MKEPVLTASAAEKAVRWRCPKGGFVNFAAEYEINSHVSIFGRIDNLTNEHYAEVFGFPALGRAAYGGVKIRF